MNKNSQGAIGVFDSGFGGIDILRDIVQELPKHNFIYLGDTARAPYGTRTQQTIYHFTEQGVKFLLEQGCPLVVLACNTASSQALPLFESRGSLMGIIKPTVKAALYSKPERVGIIATEATVRSNTFLKEIKKLSNKTEVFQNPAPLLVPIVEEGEESSKIAELAVEEYLAPLLKKNIDVLILGCTHFGVLEPKIREQVGKDVKIVREGPVMGNALKHLLETNPKLEKNIKKKGKLRFYTTDLTDKFIRLGARFLGKKITAEKIEL
jgi:glutamate racemase